MIRAAIFAGIVWGIVWAIHRPDATGSWCAHCNWEWPCRTYIYAGGGA